jgi:hypothetical protein
MTAAVLVLASTVVLAPAAAPAAGAEAIAVVYPPWWSNARALMTAARRAAVLRVGAAPFVIVVRTAGARTEADLRDDGALLVLDPRFAGCGQTGVQP